MIFKLTKSSLNFKVYTSPTIPASGTENDIVIISSTPMENWILSSDAPTGEPMNNGDVWIQYSVSGNVFDIMNQHDFMLAITKIYQYISGIWMTVDASRYIGGVWDVVSSAFSATINITYPANSTCVVTNSSGQTVASDTNSTSSTKIWTATVNATGAYTVTITATDGSGKSKSATVSITTDGQSESVTLSYELVAFLNGVTDPAVGGWTGGTVTSSVLRFDPGNGHSGRVCSNNELDLRGFTKITFHVKRLDSQDNSSSKVGISSNNANNSSFITSATMPTGGGIWYTTDVTKVIDITSVDSGYIKIYGKSSNSSSLLKIDIDKILLE